MIIYRGSRFPELDGTILVGTYLTQQILKVSSKTGAVLGDLLQEQFGPVIDVAVSPDGKIYFATATQIVVVE